MLIASIPHDDERHQFALLFLQRVFLHRVDVARAPCGLFAAEVFLELRYHVEGKCIVLCAARPIHYQVVPVSITRRNVFSNRAEESNTA